MSEGRKFLISILVVVVVMASVSIWLFLGMQKSRETEETITREKTKLEQLQEKIAKVPELSRQQKKLAGELQEYETILPNDAELSKIFDTLDEVQNKAGLQILSFKPIKERRGGKKTTDTSSYRKVSYDLDLEGDYFSLVKFVNLLENHNRFMQVDSFTVKQANEDSPVNDMSVKVSTFVYNPKSKAKRSTKKGRTKKTPKRKARTIKKAAPEVPFNLKEELASRYVFRESIKRRDPFSNPLTRHLDAGVGIARPDPKRIMTLEQEKQVTGKIDTQLTLAQRMLDRRQLDDTERLLGEARHLMGGNFRDPECYRRQFGFGRRAQKLEFTLRMARGEDLYKTLIRQQKKLEKAFEQGDYETVYDIRDAIKDTIGNAKDKVIHTNLEEIVNACDALSLRANTRREFAEVPIDIEATFWSSGRKKRRAAAIINGQTLVEGDRLSLENLKVKKGAVGVDGDVIVSKIDRSGITFRYKDELIQKLLEED